MADEITDRQLFHEWLERHARGTLDEEATAGMAELVESVTDLGKKGKLVIEVIVEPAGSGGRTVTIGGRVSVNGPKPAPELAVYYGGDAGSLHRDDPYQHRLPGVPVRVEGEDEPRSVAPDESAPKRVSDAPGPTKE